MLDKVGCVKIYDIYVAKQLTRFTDRILQQIRADVKRLAQEMLEV